MKTSKQVNQNGPKRHLVQNSGPSQCRRMDHIPLLQERKLVHCSTLAGSRFVHQVMLSVHSSTLAGSRVVHKFSHQSTFLHLLGPDLYASFLTGPLFYTCWIHDSTLGFFFNFWSILLHQLGPELYTSYCIQCRTLDPASVEEWTDEKASVQLWTQQVQKSGPMRKLVYNSGPSKCRRMDR